MVEAAELEPELVLEASGIEDVVTRLVENELEAELVAAPPGVEEPDPLMLCPIQLLLVPA